jgi:hypothetical protein
MSTVPVPRRHALGLPSGSIRAMLGLSVLAGLWAMAIVHPKSLPATFVYLTILKLFILVHYFAAHGKHTVPGAKHALGLPSGSIRFVLLGGFAGLLTYLYKESAEFSMPDGQRLYFLIALLMAGFFIGYVLTSLFRSSTGDLPAWYQDVQAWLALLAAIGLFILVIVYGVINPSVEADQQLNIDHIEAGLSALVGFYFGART